MRYLLECEIESNREIAHDQCRMVLHAPDIARAARPGQFCMIQVSESLYPFLRRPMCFEQIRDDSISILYKVEGEGTRIMSRLLAGQTVGVQGPLGNGFPLDSSASRHIIVAGGIGVATFPALAEALVRECGAIPEVILATRTKHLILCEDEFQKLGCAVHIATDDGSAGKKAFAAHLLADLHPGPGTRVYVCGPMIMMKTTSDIAVQSGAECLVSLEAQMACGDGACLGCVVEATTESEGERRVRVCYDGPVFNTTLIDWSAHQFAYDR